MLVFGSLLVVGSLAVMVNYCKGKDHWYILQYSSDRSRSSWLAGSSSEYLHCDDKPNEEFLYRYVYDSIEQTKDLPFLHRFSHLCRAGLMEATREKFTPDELRSLEGAGGTGTGAPALQTRYTAAKVGNNGSTTEATDGDVEMAF